jgi:thiol-disulfide isomerase/thioredoxin/uncharacterized protein (UPF0548 family)
MKKILLTCFLALLCLFQKARIKLKAIKYCLGILSPPSAGRNNSTLAYFAAGVFYLAKRSVFREAYLKDQVVLLSPLSLILLLLCWSSPFLRLVAQSPGADSLPSSIGPHRGGSSRSDAFTELDDLADILGKAIYTTDVSTIDGGPRLFSLGLNEVEASDTCAEPSRSLQHRTSLPSPVSSAEPSRSIRLPSIVLSEVEASEIGHPTNLPSSVACRDHSRSASLPSQINFGLINTDQGIEVGMGENNFHPTSVPVFTSQNKQEVARKAQDSQSLASCFLNLASSNQSELSSYRKELDPETHRSLVLSEVEASDTGAELSRSLQHRTSLPSPVSGLPSSTHQTPMLSSVEASEIGHPTNLPSSVACRDHSRSASLPSQINFGLINTDQGIEVGMGENNFHPTSVPVFTSQNKQEVARKAQDSQSLASCFLNLASSNQSELSSYRKELDPETHRSLVLSEVEASDTGAELSRSLQHRTSLPSPVSGLPSSTHQTPMLSSVEASEIGHPTNLPSSVACRDHSRSASLPSQINFGLINTDQGIEVGMGENNFHPTSVPVFTSQNKQEVARKAQDSQSIASCFLNLASSNQSELSSYRKELDPETHRSLVLSEVEASDSGAELGEIMGLWSQANHSSYSSIPPPDSIRLGDQLPDDLVFTSLLNTDTPEIRLSDFRGKYLILQFWATWCTASSGFLLQAEEIQQHFGDRLQVIPVTYESKEQVAKSLALRKSLSELNLPLITEESRLRDYFPHITLPHLVLIDPEGRVRAITGAQDLTIAKLSTLLETGLGSFRPKVDKRIPFDIEDKLISGNPKIPSKNIQFQSALTHYIPGVDGASMESFEDGTHLLFVNTSLIKLYRHAFTGRDLPNYFGFNRILSEGFEEEELTTTKSGLDYLEWMEKGGRVFGYELIAPPGVDGYALMREDLKRFFPHIEAKVEQRPRMVWALIQQEGKSYPKSTATKSYQVQPGTARLRNSLLTGFIYQLNLYFMQRSPYPVMNLTGIDYPVDIDLEANFSKPEELKLALNQVGLDLVLREVSIPVLILTKTNPSPFTP